MKSNEGKSEEEKKKFMSVVQKDMGDNAEATEKLFREGQKRNEEGSGPKNPKIFFLPGNQLISHTLRICWISIQDTFISQEDLAGTNVSVSRTKSEKKSLINSATEFKRMELIRRTNPKATRVYCFGDRHPVPHESKFPSRSREIWESEGARKPSSRKQYS